jgi:hypothetical protein
MRISIRVRPLHVIVAVVTVFLSAQGLYADQLVAGDNGLTVVDVVTTSLYGSTTITWLADANFAASLRPGDLYWVPGINPDGSMSLVTAVAFIQQLNNYAYLGITTWRLPTTYYGTSLATSDLSCTGVSLQSQNRFAYDCGEPLANYSPNPAYPYSELAGLFYNGLGGQANTSITMVHNSSYWLFRNLQNYLYWSDTAQSNNPRFGSDFWFQNGFEATEDEYDSMYVLPVSTTTTGTPPSFQPACPSQASPVAACMPPLLPGLGITTPPPIAWPLLLPSLDGRLIYDPALDLTFLADANLAASLPPNSPYRVAGINPDGSMNDDTVQTFINALNNGAYLGYTSWMVPTISYDGQNTHCSLQRSAPDIDIGYNCTGPKSQLGELFYGELGGEAGHDIRWTSNWLALFFRNLQPSYYWQCQPPSEGAVCPSGTGGGQPSFSFRSGYQGHQTDINELFVILALPGDAIPIWQRWW